MGLPKSEGTMSLNFPFILLGILQLSPLQAVCLAVFSVIAQCRIRVVRPFTLLQILFNVANVTTATVVCVVRIRFAAATPLPGGAGGWQLPPQFISLPTRSRSRW